MRKLALIVAGATALPLIAAAPSLAQQNGPQKNQPQSQMQQPQNQPSGQPSANKQSANQPSANDESANSGQNAAANLNQDEIRQVQQALDQKGLDAGRADGKLGPRTKHALNQFQKKQGLRATGSPDDQTLAALGIGGGSSTTGQGPSEPQNSSSKPKSQPAQPQQQPAGRK